MHFNIGLRNDLGMVQIGVAPDLSCSLAKALGVQDLTVFIDDPRTGRLFGRAFEGQPHWRVYSRSPNAKEQSLSGAGRRRPAQVKRSPADHNEYEGVQSAIRKMFAAEAEAGRRHKWLNIEVEDLSATLIYLRDFLINFDVIVASSRPSVDSNVNAAAEFLEESGFSPSLWCSLWADAAPRIWLRKYRPMPRDEVAVILKVLGSTMDTLLGQGRDLSNDIVSLGSLAKNVAELQRIADHSQQDLRKELRDLSSALETSRIHHCEKQHERQSIPKGLFVSYAQNFEDVILWRCLKNEVPACYVDVGAHHPIVDSVSKAFFLRGWRGVHVEPVATYAKLLREDRPGERIYQAAASDVSGAEVQFFEIHGYSTGDRSIADMHARAGHKVHECRVLTITLDEVFAAVGSNPVHWLKIDVEGMEKSVLDGWKTSPTRPWIVVVESTLPESQEETYSSWEGALLAKDYHYCYFDGLNRFYVHEDKVALQRLLTCGPNVFDKFAFSGTSNSSFAHQYGPSGQPAS